MFNDSSSQFIVHETLAFAFAPDLIDQLLHLPYCVERLFQRRADRFQVRLAELAADRVFPLLGCLLPGDLQIFQRISQICRTGVEVPLSHGMARLGENITLARRASEGRSSKIL